MALFGLAKTRDSLFGKLSRAVAGRSRIDDDVLDSIEEALIASDVGVDTAIELIEAIEARVAEKQYLGAKELQTLIREALLIQLEAWGSVKAPVEAVKGVRPHVTLVVGVNGVGKTTTIGKLATFYKQQGQSVLLGAADTFRAAAVDQLRIWAERSGASFVEKGMHTDPAAVAFAAVESAVNEGIDRVFVDTAGRLHNKVNLMNELAKIKRVMAKVLPDAPHEVLLVLDASTGQNAVNQAVEFSKVTSVDGLILTKMDGTARGGVALAIASKLHIPVRFIGVGEAADDLQAFDAKTYIEELLNAND